MPPINDFGLINFESVVVGSRQTRRRTDRTVDVEHRFARPTDQMMVVVTDTIFVPSRRSCRLDSTDEVLVYQYAERVVDSLARNGAEVGSNIVGKFVGRGVSMRRKSSHDRKALGSDLHPVVTEQLLDSVSHGQIQTYNLD